ncbi:hypothetical protein CHUAL_002630 [Chamberlinius hualienensis]
MDLRLVENSMAALNDLESIICSGINNSLANASEKAQLEQDVKDDCFDAVKETMAGYATSHNKILLFKEAFKEIKSSMENVDTLPKDLDEKLSNFYEEKCQNIPAPESHSGYKTLISVLSEILSPDEVNTETVNNDDSELVISETQTIPIDPITKLEVIEPVRSRLCHHKYDRTSITEFIQRRNKAKCPMIGCKEALTEDMLEIDDEVLLLINRKQRLLNAYD